MKFYIKRRQKLARKRSNSTIKTCPVICRGTGNGYTFDCNTGLVKPNNAVPLTNEKYRKQYYKKQYKGV